MFFTVKCMRPLLGKQGEQDVEATDENAQMKTFWLLRDSAPMKA
jgi:hypothetical protein